SPRPSASPTPGPDVPEPVDAVVDTVRELVPTLPPVLQAPLLPAPSATRAPLLDVHLDLPVVGPLIG
ncbi:MAG: hypothetical protein JWO60_1149, partial [Frankiales bacterium]|nr:hypothetical protein [Frankiales bacterium]